MNSFRFCPFCGTPYPASQAEEPHKYCSSCQKNTYDGMRATGSAVIIENNQLLLVRRAIDPFKGLWDVVGGFSEPFEHPTDTVRREVLEEIGVECEVLGLHGVYGPVPYEFQGHVQSNLDLYYDVRVLSHDFHPADDAAECRWFPLTQLPPLEEISFASAKQLIAELAVAHN